MLEQSGKTSQEEIAKLEEGARQQRKSLQDLVYQRGLLSEEQLVKAYSQVIDVPFVKIDPNEVDTSLLKLIPEHIARRYQAVVFESEDEVKHLAVEDPGDLQALDFIEKQLGSKPVIYIASKQNISQVLDLYRGEMSSELTKVIAEDTEAESEQPEVTEEEVAEDSPIAQTVSLLIEFAIKANASDIHIEPREDFVMIRYRVDGVLREADRLPKKVQAALVSRIKILANLKIDERRIPQDGRFKINQSGKLFALRVSTLPIADGEKVVIRLLDETNEALSLETLGYWGSSLEVINRAIIEPHGMILVTGPTGSGKSTSLYSILTLLNNYTVNISTVEDPIEYKIIGANQTQVNPKAGMTFASGLRALLRQDPNIIMVGEIRDTETADMAVQAALTGHLVFSTLHTNNAATCLPRLLDMGVEPFLIASTVRAVVGQRLVRHLCQSCRTEYKPDGGWLEQVTTLFKLDKPGVMERVHNLEKRALEEGLGKKDSNPSTSQNGILRLWRASEKGCEECSHSGYGGRLGIYEVLENGKSVAELIVKNGTSRDIEAAGIEAGMMTMQQDGLIKALRGLTTIEEILRVTRS